MTRIGFLLTLNWKFYHRIDVGLADDYTRRSRTIYFILGIIHKFICRFKAKQARIIRFL